MNQIEYSLAYIKNRYGNMATIDPSNYYYTISGTSAPHNVSGIPAGSWVGVGAPAGTAVTFNWNPTPSMELLADPEVFGKLVSKMVTLYKPEDPLVICVDHDVSQEQVDLLADELQKKGMRGVIVPGARAGSGMPIYRPIKPGHERIDILARIGEVWERKPELSLTQLLSWWKGESMGDDEFAAATDVHFRKLFEDWTY